MKTSIRYFALLIVTAFLPTLHARTLVDFNDSTSYKNLGVYDSWEQSPFRNGELHGNWAIMVSPKCEKGTCCENNEDKKNVFGAQRSRFGSNLFGARIDLNQPIALTPETKEIKVLMNKPLPGRVALIGLGSREERLSQNPDTEQFVELSVNPVEPGEWQEACFMVKGATGSLVRSLVIVPDCESPHNLTEDFLFYIKKIEID